MSVEYVFHVFHFRTKNFISFFFSICPRSMGLPLFLERFSSAQDVSLLVSFPSRSSSFCSLSGLFLVASLIFFFGLQNTSPSLFRTGPYEHLAATSVLRLTSFCSVHYSRLSPVGLFCLAPRCPLSFDRLPFVPRTSSRLFSAALLRFASRFLLSCD